MIAHREADRLRDERGHDAVLQANEDARIIRLSAEGQRQIAEALLNPARPNAALRRAFQHHRNLFGLAR